MALEIDVLRHAVEAAPQIIGGAVDRDDHVDGSRPRGGRAVGAARPVEWLLSKKAHRGVRTSRPRARRTFIGARAPIVRTRRPHPSDCRVRAVSTSVIERRYVAGRPLRWREELRDIWRHAALLYELVHRDLTVRYKRSLLGFLWTMLHPLLLMLIFVVVFSAIFRGNSPHYETYFLSAYIAWNFFAQTTTNAMAAVAWNGPLMKRVRVPPSIFTLSTVVSGLVNVGLSLIVLFTIMLVVGAPLRASLWFLPVSLLLVGVFSFGAALALTAISIFFGDVREMVQAGMPALMYLTPIIYPLSIV